MTPRRRRLLAGTGLFVPAVALVFVSVFIGLGGAGTQTCTTGGASTQTSCSSDPVGAVLATFPAAVVCLVLSASVFRGARWARWPAVAVAAVVATVTAAAGLAVLVALIGDGQALGAVFFAVGGVLLVAVCAMPAVALGQPEGAEALPGRGAPVGGSA